MYHLLANWLNVSFSGGVLRGSRARILASSASAACFALVLVRNFSGRVAYLPGAVLYRPRQ